MMIIIIIRMIMIVAPGLRAGRGLKRNCVRAGQSSPGSSRPSGWERIETASAMK